MASWCLCPPPHAQRRQAEGSAPGARRESQGPHGWAEVGAHAMTQKKPTLWASSRGPEWPGLPTPPPGVPRCVILAHRPTPQLEPGLGD